VLIVNAPTETTNRGEAATASFLWNAAQELGMEFPQAADPEQKLYRFVTAMSLSLPLTIGIDLRTMKVVQITEGGGMGKAEIEALAAKTLGGP